VLDDSGRFWALLVVLDGAGRYLALDVKDDTMYNWAARMPTQVNPESDPPNLLYNTSACLSARARVNVVICCTRNSSMFGLALGYAPLAQGWWNAEEGSIQARSRRNDPPPSEPSAGTTVSSADFD